MPLDPLTHLPTKDESLANSIKALKFGITKPKELKFEDSIPLGGLGIDAKKTYDAQGVNLDRRNIFLEDVNKLRAKNQSTFKQSANATVGGLAKGVLGALEGASYVLDFDNHIKAIQGLDTTEKNWFAEAMISGKEGLDKSLPIYREDPNTVLDWDDPAFYLESWRELVNSAVQFAVPGGAITKGFSALGKLSKANKLVSYLSHVSPTFAKIVGGAPSALVMNEMEGKIMGLELADEIGEELRPLLDSGEITLEEFNQAKMEAHNNMVSMNKLLLPVTMFQLPGVMKGAQYTRNLLKERTIKNRFKDFGKSIIAPNSDNLILQNLGEGAEEIAQGVMSGESKYQALKGIGKEEGSELFIDRLIEYASKDETLLEGMMGFFGGGIQRILTETASGKYTKASREQHSKLLQEQKAMQSQMENYFTGKLESAAPFRMAKNKAMQSGDIASAEAIDNMMFAREAVNHFKLGTTEMLENYLNDIANGNITAEQAEYMGEDAQQKAVKLIDKLKSYEETWAKLSMSPVQHDIFTNRVTRNALAESLTHYENSLSEIDNSIRTEITNNLIPLLKNSKDTTYDIDAVLDAVHQDLKDKDAGKEVKRDLSSDLNKLIVATSNLENIYDYFNTKNNITKAKAHLSEYDKEYRTLKTPKGEEQRLKEIERAKEMFQKTHEFKSETETESITTPKKDDFIEDKLGNVYKVDNYNKEKDTWELSTIDGRKKLNLSNKKFEDNFKNKTNNSFKRRVDKKVVDERKKETKNQTNAKTDTSKRDPIDKANKAKDTIKSPTNPKDVEPKTFDDTKKTNTTAEVKINKENETREPNRLTWKSSNNISGNSKDSSKRAQDLADYLENPNNPIKGTTVKIEKDKDFENGIKVTLLDNEGNVITNNDTEISLYIPEPKGNSEEDNILKAYRESLLKSIEENNGIVYSTIDSISPGYLQWTNNKTNLDVATGIKAEDLDLSILIQAGKFFTGKRNGNYVQDYTLMRYDNSEIGGVYVKVKTSNGTVFPLRVTLNTVSDEDANLITNLYLELLNNKKINDVVSDEIKKQIKSSPVLKGIVGVFPDFNNVTYNQLLGVLIHEGHNAKEFSEFPVWIDKRTLYYGKGDFHNSMSLKDLQENPQPFIDWLTSYKIKNVDVDHLANPKYKKYLVESGTLQTKALFNERGIVFAQPQIKISNSISLNTSVESTEDISEQSEQLNDIFEKAIEEKEKSSNNENDKKNEEINEEMLENSNFEIENIIKNDLIEYQDMLFTTEKITASKRKSVSDILELFEIYKTEILSGEINVDVIKEQFKEIIKNCK